VATKTVDPVRGTVFRIEMSPRKQPASKPQPVKVDTSPQAQPRRRGGRPSYVACQLTFRS
jgi:hypothetical protein